MYNSIFYDFLKINLKRTNQPLGWWAVCLMFLTLTTISVRAQTDYCVPSFISGASYIKKFETTGGSTNINNETNAQSTGGYGDFTSQSVVVTSGTSFDFSVAYQSISGVAIWIDWNDNGIFEADERIFNTTSFVIGSVSGTIYVPMSALETYRMRVLCSFLVTNPNDPCIVSTSSGEVEDYTIDVQIPCSPITSINTSGVTQTSIDVSWTAGATETSWNIEYGTAGFTQGSGTTLNGVTNPYTITGLTAGTSYDVYVQADCGNGNTSTWEMVNFTTDAAFSCPNPLNAGTVTTTPNSGSAQSTFDVTATGYDTGGDVTYTWEKSEDNGATWILVGTANNSTYTDLIGEIAPDSGEVEYRLTISCGGNTASATGTFTTTVNITTFDLFGFSYHPNPVNDILHFSSNSKIENVTINNILGQEINANLNSDNTTLDMSNLPSGNYFVKVTIEGVSKTIKVIKN